MIMARPVNFYTMRNAVAITAVALCAYAAEAGSFDGALDLSGMLPAAWLSAIKVDSAALAAGKDTTTIDTLTTADNGNIDAVNLADEDLLRAALAVDSVKISESTNKLALIRRDYEYKQQTRAAIVMMIFIAVAMATSQSWNPR